MDEHTAPATPATRKRPLSFYLHSSKDSNYERAVDDGFGEEMSQEAMDRYIYTGYEVRLDCEVDLDTGIVHAIGLEGVKLERPVIV